MGYIYGLDLSLNSTGICIFTNDGKFFDKFTIDTKGEKNTPMKLKLIGNTFIDTMEIYYPEKIIIEQGFTRYNKSTQAVFRVHGVANYIFCDYPQEYIPATTVKKLIGGKGNISKKQLQDVLLLEYPDIHFKNYDESDAFALVLAYFAMERNNNAEKNSS